MAAFNVVRFRVKPGFQQPFEDAHRDFDGAMPGGRRFVLVKTGDRDYCVVGEWDGMEALAAARPHMIAQLDRLRPMLEDLGPGLGVTDAVSGEVAVDVR